MSENFFGPWQITVGQVNTYAYQSFTISGSENADGRYTLFGEDPATIEVIVQGKEWAIEPEWLNLGADYVPSDVRRATKFVVNQGIIVTLDAYIPDFPHPIGGNLTLICTSLDPETNPIPTSNPYDFTIHER